MRKTLAGIAGLVLATACTATPSTPSGGAPTTFKVQIQDVSTASTLQPSTGPAQPAPVSPGTWSVFASGEPVFMNGKPATLSGLKQQAEDGNPAPLAAQLTTATGVASTGTFTIPDGDTTAGPATPGKTFTFTVSAAPGAHLTFTSMFGQSNDCFYSFGPDGIALFGADGKPVSGDMTSQVQLWDAGTEMNQEPGVGPDQAPRQKAPGQGTPDPNANVRPVSDGFTYPAVNQVVKVTITPQ